MTSDEEVLAAKGVGASAEGVGVNVHDEWRDVGDFASTVNGYLL